MKSRRKGRRAEQEVVRLARLHGLSALRTWETAQHADPSVRCCDVRIAEQPFQVKRSRDGFRKLYDGLVNVAGLFVRSDGQEWLVTLRAADYLQLLTERQGESRSINL